MIAEGRRVLPGMLAALLMGCSSPDFSASREAHQVELHDVAAGVLAQEAGHAGDPLPPLASRPVLVRDADLTVRVGDVEAAVRRIRAFAEGAGGFVLSSRLDAITVKVPSARLDDLVDRIADLGELTHRSVHARDATAEFYDLEARLQNARATREKLVELLARAGSVSEALQVQRELAGVQELVERLEGRLRMLRDQATLSEVRVSVEKKRTPGPVVWVLRGAGWVIEKLFWW